MSVGLHYLLNGELVEILGLVIGYLLTVDTKSLVEIAVTVEEADCGHVDTAVGSFFYIVAGEHAETTGVDFEAVAEAILHREV